tara:strand:- start:357 stop:1934 length:1578 start_codon:yes stop_codon:yes gene_type:complete
MIYEGIVIAGGFFAFVAAMGIGANDVANAYATAVGSKSLTIKQSVVLAAIFETSGAILMGSHVSNTIRKGIADYECFDDDPGPLMYGCMCVCISVGFWLFLASKYEMPVSTTHSCVGGMIGMTIALKGTRCVNWYEKKELFPYVGGVAGIVLSWIISPVASAIIASTLFSIIRSFILRSRHSVIRTTIFFPVLIGGTVTLNSFFIIYKGAKGMGLHETPLNIACLWSFGIGGSVAILVIPFLPKIRYNAENYIQNIQTRRQTNLESNELSAIELQETTPQPILERQEEIRQVQESDVNVVIKDSSNLWGLTTYINKSLKVDLNDIVTADETVNSIHANAELFDDTTEEYFKSLQVFTAICDSFSHGANDVANAIGPFMAIYMIGKNGSVDKENSFNDITAYWMLAIGGVGISFGLFIYGYKILHAIGIKLCKLTPSRGCAIELASAIVIITGSRLEIPLSTTHCQVGATLGVAALEDPRHCSGINLKIVSKCIGGWIMTLIVVGCTTAALTAQGAYSPEVGVHCD